MSNGDAVQHVADFGFWLDRLATAPKELLLPVDRPHPAEPVPPRGRRTRALTVIDRLNDVSVMAGFAVLLHRYAGTADIVFGTGSLIPIRVDLAGSPSFAEVESRVRAAHAEALAHEVPFDELIGELQPERGRGGAVLVNVGFDAQTDLPLDLIVSLDGAVLEARYREDVLDGSTVDRMLRHLERLLQDAFDRPQCPVGQLNLLSENEVRQLLVDWTTPISTPSSSRCWTCSRPECRRRPTRLPWCSRTFSSPTPSSTPGPTASRTS
ncbi:hypothetical protein [Kutzneria sp. 744]|uniref:hypothetical protein n=1 Tax=Kutzneria sp. (strain 744) TaxID=345341 RepID=UPI0004B4C9C1|nr:hypothetical protein [Kutzneria sp. 744]